MIKVYCINRSYSLEFQDLLQNNGYSWHGMGDLDILQRWVDFSESTIRINEEEKSISANFRKDMNCDYIYPTDKTQIMIHLGIQRKPNYSPKKIIKEFNDYKLLESTGKYLYNSVVFEVKDREEFRILIGNLTDNGFYLKNELTFNNYPVYIFANLNYGSDEPYISYFNPDTAIINLETSMQDKENRKFNHNIYNYIDSKHVMNIFKHGSYRPSYKPKKINR